MTLHQLKIFESVARHLNVTKASHELHMSQPAVSQQLKLLEQQCDARFIVRIGQGMELTERGKVFLDAIRPIVAQVADVESTFKVKSDEKKSSFLTVGGSRSHSVAVLPEILRAFKQNHPWVQFVLESNDSGTMEQRVFKCRSGNCSHQITLRLLGQIAYGPYKEMGFWHLLSPQAHSLGRK